MRLVALACCVVALGACASSPEPPRTANLPAGTPPVEASIISNAGAQIGRAQFTPSPHGVLIRILVEPGGLPPGWHGVHLHMTGTCADTASFEASGDHVAHAETSHGLLYEYGPEAGDLPNLSAHSDGSAAAEMFSNLITLSELQDADGSALIIHAQPDDHLSQPIGGAGDRIACAALTR